MKRNKSLYQYGTQKTKVMLVISSREFRQNQRLYFERIDAGEEIIVQRGKDKSYKVTAVTEGDRYFSAEVVERIKEGIRQIENGEGVEITSRKEIQDLLGL